MLLVNGETLALGRELGRGGEGAVYEVSGRPDVVAKIYLERVNADKASKLEVMARGCTDTIQRIAAWPQAVVVDKTKKNASVGFLMRRVDKQKDIHILYGPK